MRPLKDKHLINENSSLFKGKIMGNLGASSRNMAFLPAKSQGIYARLEGVEHGDWLRFATGSHDTGNP